MTYRPKTLEDTDGFISLLELVDGNTRSSLPVGPPNEKSGLEAVLDSPTPLPEGKLEMPIPETYGPRCGD